MKKWVCKVCGYVYTGETPPEFCPQCKAPASKFEEQVSGEVTWADEHRIGVAEGVDPEILEGLRQNFQGECTEVGMYRKVQSTTRPLLLRKRSMLQNLQSCWVRLSPTLPRRIWSCA